MFHFNLMISSRLFFFFADWHACMFFFIIIIFTVFIDWLLVKKYTVLWTIKINKIVIYTTYKQYFITKQFVL